MPSRRRTMKSVSLIAGLGVLLAALAIPSLADDKKSGDKDKDGGQGWVQLFNGKDLTGWKVHPQPSGRGKDIEEVLKKEKDGKVIGFDGKVKDGKVVALW